MKTLFIFHRDLRKEDNIGLIKTIQNSDVVYPIFIFTPEQIGNQNKYRSLKSIRFMIQSLQELENNLPISFFYGNTNAIVNKLTKQLKIDTIAFNKDFTPYAIKRDTELSNNKNYQTCQYDDITLNSMEDCLKKDGTPYRIFTPYFNNASKNKIEKPLKWSTKYNSKCQKISGGISLQKFQKMGKESIIEGGRRQGLKILKKVKQWKKYNESRNYPAIDTTRLSPHLKFGTVSCREVYHLFMTQLGSNNELVKQLYWRDFYMTMLKFFPSYTKSVTNPKMNDIKWKYSRTNLDKWQKGITGIPIVDAGMRELNESGYMHGRVRMIVATFLIYNLGLNWKDGETYFSQKLVDVDVANNLGNWKWVAGIESYSNDYYKAMSMTSQIERFDPKCQYIKKWCPELEPVPIKDIINWEETYQNYKNINYPKPIVNTKKSRQEMIENIKKTIKS